MMCTSSAIASTTHERHDHAAQHVVVEAEQVVEAERPDDADEHGAGREQRPPPRSEHRVDGDQRQRQDRRRELRLVGERDAVVGLADLEAAVEVARWKSCGSRGRDDRAGSPRSPRARTSSTRRSSKKTTIDATVPSAEMRSPLQQLVVERALGRRSAGDFGRRDPRSSRTDVERPRRRPAAGRAGRASTSVAVARLATRSTVSTRSMSALTSSRNCKRLAAEQALARGRRRSRRSGARAAELVAEALVLLIDGSSRENQAVRSLSMRVMLARGASSDGAEDDQRRSRMRRQR